MNSTLALAFLLIGLPAAAHAGPETPGQEPTAHEVAEQKLQQMDRLLELKPDQKEKIGKILEAYSPQMLELHKKMRKLDRESHEKIRVLLDDDQREKLDM